MSSADDPLSSTNELPQPAPSLGTTGRGPRTTPLGDAATILAPSNPEELASGPAAAHTQSASPSVPGYEINGILGRGGMGVVYRARHLALKRTVALKMVLAGGHAGPRELERFRIEAEAVARLAHPNIVQVHEVGTAEGHPYCALEFIDGGTLNDKIGGQPLPPREAARLVEILARAMQLAHSRNVVHRDLKPANILLTADGIPKITDFGLARQMDMDRGQTQAGAVMGTPSYMAPEQASGRTHEAGPAADVYALGAILYECLTGRPPFQGKSNLETIDQVRAQEPTPPRRVQQDVPPDLETVCLKCLRKEPENRYSSAAELADDLLRFQQGEPIRARPVGRLERVVKWARRNPLVAGVLAALVLVTVLGVTGIVWKYAEAERQRSLAEAKEKEAQREADKAKKAQAFLESIFAFSDAGGQRGTMSARQILDDAEKRVPIEFADQPELRAELMASIEKVFAKITENAPLAMLLEVRGTVQLRSARNPGQKAAAQVLLHAGDRLTLGPDAEVQLVLLSDLHREKLKPGQEVTIRRKGCEPADAVLERDESVLMTFVPLPKGTFYMGWTLNNPKTVRTEIREEFEIAVHTVTQGQWEAVMGENPSHFSRFGRGRGRVKDITDEELKLFPVEQVSWLDAQEFIRKLNEREKDRGYVYRLPTATEWEYACRGGATSEENCSYPYYVEKPTRTLTTDLANFGHSGPEEAGGRPTRVGAFPPNQLGLHDMHGNVWQWCQDPLNPAFPHRRLRGGCYWAADTFCQAAYDSQNGQGSNSRDTGFRLVRVKQAAVHPGTTGKTDPPPTGDPVATLEKARAHASRREWKEAARAYAEMIDRSVPDWGEVAFEYAAVLLLAGDQARYKVICKMLVERCEQPGVRPYHVARACSLAADSFVPSERPGELARGELESNAQAYWSVWLQGSLHFRAGRYREALPLLQKSRDDPAIPPDGEAATRMWLSLTHHKLDQPEEARRAFALAEKWLSSYPDELPPDAERRRLGLHLHNWLEVHVLRVEARRLLPSVRGEK